MVRLPPQSLAQHAKAQAAKDRADIVDDRDIAGGVGIEMMLHLQEGRIDVLRAVAEEVERRHQQDGVKRELPMVPKDIQNSAGLRMIARPAGRFRNVTTDIENEERRQNADQKHRAP